MCFILRHVPYIDRGHDVFCVLAHLGSSSQNSCCYDVGLDELPEQSSLRGVLGALGSVEPIRYMRAVLHLCHILQGAGRSGTRRGPQAEAEAEEEAQREEELGRARNEPLLGPWAKHCAAQAVPGCCFRTYCVQ